MKNYVKPELFYEHYELSQHIADCHWEYTLAENACGAQGDSDDGLGEYIMFNDGLCNVNPDDFQDFCYTGSKDGSRLFAS